MLHFFLTVCKYSSIPFLFIGILLGTWWHQFVAGFNDSRELVCPPDEYSGNAVDELINHLQEND
jgi:hypothetical protein